MGLVLGGAAGAGLIGSGAFVTDPVGGYPPSTGAAPGRPTRAGILHDLFAVPTFLGLPAAQLAFARAFHRTGQRGWALYSFGSAAVMSVAFALASAAFGQVHRLIPYGGAFQRVSVSVGFAWLTALFVRARHASSR